ncbi:hypothetical protein P154DRAFT_414241, partial [Amniculicola lignicola CBS 123094]
MLSKTLLTLALTATAQAAAKAYVKNKCGVPLYISTVSSRSSDVQPLPNGGFWTDELKYDPLTGIAIKITSKPDGLATGAPVLHFSYTLGQEDGKTYYDLSSAYGLDDVFEGEKLELHTNWEKNCPVITWLGTPIP